MSSSKKWEQPSDAAHFYMNELTHRIVAESGRPSDRFHLGKQILQGLKDEPELILQIDGATGERESSASVLRRSVRCARALRARGLRRGDVVVLMAPNHLDLCIPYYACLYLGLAIAPVDRLLTVKELHAIISIDEPKIIFCQSEKTADVRTVLETLNMDAEIVAFDKSVGKISSFEQFLQEHLNDEPVDKFKAEDFDPEDTISLLIPTTGTTGVPKQIMCSHKNITVVGPYIFCFTFNSFPKPTDMALIVSPLQWMSACIILNATPIFRFTRLQSSLEYTQQHTYDLINKYKPTFMIVSPTFMMTLTKPDDCDRCDFSCFRCLLVVGSAMPTDLVGRLQRLAPNTPVFDGYGMSEVCGAIFQPSATVTGSNGKPCGLFQYRMVDPETNKDIVEPNVTAEVWVKGPSVVMGYFKNPEATKEAFAEDGWIKTGDLFYRDDSSNFFFVERNKMLLKYRNHQISPTELEEVIRGHPAVDDVAVGGLPDPECGELPVACVVRRKGRVVTAQDIKDLVKGALTDSKQLRGGVIFLEKLPLTSTGKVNRKGLKELISEMGRE